jgi:hypothetical protein
LLLERKWGGDRNKRSKTGRCEVHAPHAPTLRCYDPDPLRNLSAASLTEILEGRRAEVRAAMYRVLADEFEEPRWEILL